MTKLKPCPFCGGEAIMQKDRRWPDGYDDGVTTYEVICTNTNCVIYRADNRYFLTKQDAINAWNRRVEDKK